METWKPIPGYEGVYEVSSSGRVRSVDRVRPHFQVGERVVRGKVLCNNRDTNGYLSVTLSDGSRLRRHRVHRLVAAAFIPPINGADHVDHKDGNRTNNNVLNLQWVSLQRNNRLTATRGRSTRGVKNPRAKLTDDDIRAIRKAAGGVGLGRLADAFGVSKSAISLILRRERWAHVA